MKVTKMKKKIIFLRTYVHNSIIAQSLMTRRKKKNNNKTTVVISHAVRN